MSDQNLESRSDEEILSLRNQASNDLVSDKKELTDLVENGLSQPDERVIELRARIQRDKLVVDETERIQKEREQKKTT